MWWRQRLRFGGCSVPVVAGSAPPPLYTASAVHFDGDTFFTCPSLTAVNGDYVSYSAWFKMALGDRAQDPSLAVLDPTNNLGFNQIWYNVPAPFRLDLNNADGGNTYRIFTPNAPNDVWFHILISAFTNATAGNKIAKIYVNDVDVTNTSDLVGPVVVPFNGQSFLIGTDGFGGHDILDASDWWIANQSLLTGNDISEATRRKFISADGKPVYLGANGELPTGTAPLIYFSGDEATFGQPNLGSAGSFTPTGALTNASSSPSD